MKYARSILLGEDVDADEVDHADTVGFQIVCPCCSESVIKVCRPLDDQRTTEFFSHRQGSPERNAECEMRVASLSRQERAVWDARERRQTMEAFRSVLSSVLEVDLEARGVRDHKRSYRRLTESGMFRGFVDSIKLDHIKHLARRTNPSSKNDPIIKEMKQSVDKFDRSTKNPFPQRVAERCENDLMAHLLTDQGRKSYERLYGHAVMCVTANVHRAFRRERVSIGGVQMSPVDHRAMLKAAWHPNPRKSALSGLLAAETKDPHSRHDLAHLFFRTIEFEMNEVIIQLPYFRMLENYRNGVDVTDGLKDIFSRRARMHEMRMGQGPKAISPEMEKLYGRLSDAAGMPRIGVDPDSFEAHPDKADRPSPDPRLVLEMINSLAPPPVMRGM